MSENLKSEAVGRELKLEKVTVLDVVTQAWKQTKSGPHTGAQKFHIFSSKIPLQCKPVCGCALQDTVKSPKSGQKTLSPSNHRTPRNPAVRFV